MSSGPLRACKLVDDYSKLERKCRGLYIACHQLNNEMDDKIARIHKKQMVRLKPEEGSESSKISYNVSMASEHDLDRRQVLRVIRSSSQRPAPPVEKLHQIHDARIPARDVYNTGSVPSLEEPWPDQRYVYASVVLCRARVGP